MNAADSTKGHSIGKDGRTLRLPVRIHAWRPVRIGRGGEQGAVVVAERKADSELPPVPELLEEMRLERPTLANEAPNKGSPISGGRGQPGSVVAEGHLVHITHEAIQLFDGAPSSERRPD